MGRRKTRDVSLEVRVDAPLNDVWRALATGEGMRRWFPFDARIDARPGGEAWVSWGPGMDFAVPLAWCETGKRFGWLEPRPDEDGEKVELAVDFTLESNGSSTVVRVVNSGFGTSASWDNEVDSISRGWLVYLRHLKFSLERHPGVDRRVVYVEAKIDAPIEDAWSRMFSRVIAAGGAPGRVNEGERLVIAGPVGAALAGRVEVWNAPKDLAMIVEALNDAHLWVEIYPTPRARMAKATLSLYGVSTPLGDEIESRWKERIAAAYADVART